MNEKAIDLHPHWFQLLKAEFEQDYMQSLLTFLRIEKFQGKVIYPSDENMFAALNTTPLQDIRVVILGQDPYHGPNQAHGLSFSVPSNEPLPPSLKNIYKELSADLGCEFPVHGNLDSWARQGVLLLNSVLTVEHSKAASHQGRGWERFTDRIIELISSNNENMVFLLWGAYAQKKGAIIDSNKHLILLAPHPSPLSAHRGFLGCGHFSQSNQYLIRHGYTGIDWQIR